MADAKIQVRNNGPLRVTGPFDLIDAEGKVYTLPQGQWVSLCRCGASTSKPFCDGTHSKAERKAQAGVFDGPSKAK
jgi:CDGSH-type Zn-finger protein